MQTITRNQLLANLTFLTLVGQEKNGSLQWVGTNTEWIDAEQYHNNLVCEANYINPDELLEDEGGVFFFSEDNDGRDDDGMEVVNSNKVYLLDLE